MVAHETALVVESGGDRNDQLVGRLRTRGLAVYRCESALEGLAYLRCEEPPALAVLDLRRPVVGVGALLRLLREKPWSSLPLFIFAPRTLVGADVIVACGHGALIDPAIALDVVESGRAPTA